MGADGSADLGRRVPQLAAAYDPTTLALSPAEGFLLSRIDGATPWKLLREFGGLSPEEVDLVLEGWVARGIVECKLLPPPVKRERPAPAAAQALREVDRASLDESLEIDLEAQLRILEFETKLDAPYHEILGIDLKADAKAVKRAYFELSKEFHPDRYFRKEIGAYEKRLHVVFKRILEAYELLSDPTVRAEVEKSMTAAVAAKPVVGPEPVAPGEPPRELTKLERLRARMPYKLPSSLLADREQRAREFWEAAQRSVNQSRFIEAASSVRLAIAFDPFNDVYRSGFGDVQVRAVEMKAEALMAEAEGAAAGLVDRKQSAELLRLYEEALLYRPHAPDLNERAARAAIQCEEYTKALEYGERALDHSPEVASHHVTIALVHRGRGNFGHAVKALEKAVELEPKNQEASMLLATLRRA